MIKILLQKIDKLIDKSFSYKDLYPDFSAVLLGAIIGIPIGLAMFFWIVK